MTYKNPQKFDLKIRLYNQEKSFGKGVYELVKFKGMENFKKSGRGFRHASC